MTMKSDFQGANPPKSSLLVVGGGTRVSRGGMGVILSHSLAQLGFLWRDACSQKLKLDPWSFFRNIESPAWSGDQAFDGVRDYCHCHLFPLI